MVIKAPDAISAYKVADMLGTGQKTPTDKNDTFMNLVKTGLETAVQAGKESEHMSAQYIAGKADLSDVVAAVRNAEMTLSTVVSIRDRVISSFQELLRMPI